MADEVISKADKARITRLDNIDSAFVMLFLVNQFHTEQLSAFPKELILGICWEESFFQNIPQLGGPAVGYGQLERDGRRIANQHATNNLSDFTEGSFTAAAILASREKSISAVSHCLAGLFDQLGKSQAAALDGYAGVKQRPANAPIPGRWKDCATALQNVLAGGSFNPIAFEDALRKAREFESSGPVYNHIHSRLWPLVDLLQQLVGQVQIGSQGPQVMIVQDSINRLQNVEPGLGFAPLPLAVDGQFGPKTHSGVKEFQAKNSLVSDGVVGPRTRGAIKDKAQAFPTA